MANVDVKNLEADVAVLKYWMKGNGTKGAAERIIDHDDRIDVLERLQDSEEARIKAAMHEAMAERAKSREGKSRANAPIYAALISTIGMIIISLLTIIFGA